MSWYAAWQAYRAQPATGVTAEAVEQDAFTAGWEAAKAETPVEPYMYFLGPKPSADPAQWQAYLEYARECRRAGSTVLPFMSWQEGADRGPWRDSQGDVWSLGDDGLLHTPETAPFSREHVEKKWGPLVPVPADAGADHG